MAFGYRDTILFPTSATAELEDHCMVASGTSLASPAAAAIASMLLAIRPSLYNDDVINIMKLSCYTDLVDPPPGISFEFYYGAGLLQANAAIELLLTNALYGDVIATGPDDVEEIHDGIIEHVGNVPGLPMGAYDVYKYACFANATFPVSFLYPPHVWGRSVGTVGVGPFTELKPYSYSEFDKTHYCGVIDSTVTATSCQLLTYTYRFIDQSQQEHWFPCHYDSVVFSYAALGKDGIVAVEDNTPSVYSIRAFPNPFNAAVKISLYAIRSSEADVSVYNIRGEKVTTLHRGILLRGLHELNWDGRDNNDRICASGTYIIRIDDGIRAQRVQVAFVK
jgi:hypothetical protein